MTAYLLQTDKGTGEQTEYGPPEREQEAIRRIAGHLGQPPSVIRERLMNGEEVETSFNIYAVVFPASRNFSENPCDHLQD